MISILPRPDLKFFVSWITCFATMYGLSYLWHGVVLNDFLKISYPKDVFLLVSALVYFGVAFAITALTYVLKRIKDSFRFGALIGAAIGIFIYAIAFLLGVSFNATVDFKMVAFDLGWQIMEQGAGGVICGWVYRLMYMRERRLSH